MKVLKIIAVLMIAILASAIEQQIVNVQTQSKQEQYNQEQRIYQSNVKSLSMRLTPNQDIMTTVTQLISKSKHNKKISALSIASAVGSVNYCWLRLANQSVLTKVKGPMEIVSLSGTFDFNLQPHVHISLSTNIGETIGGHLPSLQQRQSAFKSQNNKIIANNQNQQTPFGCPIFTTLELVLLSHENIVYQRKIDPVTTFHQLTIRKKHFYQK